MYNPVHPFNLNTQVVLLTTVELLMPGCEDMYVTRIRVLITGDLKEKKSGVWGSKP